MKMVKYYVCQCYFDIAISSNYDNIDEFCAIIQEYGFLKKNFIWYKHNDVNYVCCKDMIHFLYNCYPEVYETCMDDCPNAYADTTSINCLDLFVYGFEDICSNCENILLTYFLRFLEIVKK